MQRPSPKILLSVIFIAGLTGMMGQVLMIRELLISFYGNELILGLILGGWILFEAIGAGIAGRMTKKGTRLILFLSALLLYGFVLPAALYLSFGLALRPFETVRGQMPHVSHMIPISIGLTAPISLIHGMLFPFACAIYEQSRTVRATVTGTLYLVETAGTLLAGVLFSLYLAQRASSMPVAVTVGVVHGGIVLLLCFFCLTKRRAKVAIGIFVLLVSGIFLWFFQPITAHLHKRAVMNRWPDQHVIADKNTPYGNITVLQSQGEYSFFYDGTLALTLPLPDTAMITAYVHPVMAAHEHPQKVLIIGSGLGGPVDHVLQHNPTSVTVVELDPVWPNMIKRYGTSLTEREMADQRVQLQTLDGRLYLSRTDHRYDVVMLGLFHADTLQMNRLYTLEFFESIQSRLNDSGLFAFTVPGSDVYIGREAIRWNACLYHTASSVFQHVKVIAGDDHVFLCSDHPIDVSSTLWSDRLQLRDVPVSFVTPRYLEYRLDSGRMLELEQMLQTSDATEPNLDFSPRAFYHALAYWGRAYAPFFLSIFSFLSDIGGIWWLLPILLCLTPIGFVMMANKKKVSSGFSYSIFTSGMEAMGFDILILFVFQTVYGVVFQMAGLLMGVFLFGMCAGALWSNRKVNIENHIRLFKVFEIIATILPIVFYVFATALGQFAYSYASWIIITAIGGFSLCTGFCLGAPFPIASFHFETGGVLAGQTAGKLVAADLAGGFFGALLITLFLFPLLGLWTTLLILTAIKAGSAFVLFFVTGRPMQAV